MKLADPQKKMQRSPSYNSLAMPPHIPSNHTPVVMSHTQAPSHHYTNSSPIMAYPSEHLTYSKSPHAVAQIPYNGAEVGTGSFIASNSVPRPTYISPGTGIVHVMPVAYGQKTQVRQEFLPVGVATSGIPAQTFKTQVLESNVDPLFSAQMIDLLHSVDERNLTPLMKAVVRNDVPQVKDLLKTEAGLCIENGVTALMIAAHLGHADCVKLLAPKEAGMRQNDGTTALMEAVMKGHSNIVSLLIKSEGGIRRDDGFSSLMICAQYNYIEIGRKLLPIEARLQTDLGVTALMIAAENDADDMVILLSGKEAGMRANNGWTCSMSLAAKGRVDLLKKVASKEAGFTKDDGWTCLMSACAIDNLTIAKMFIKEAGFTKSDGTCALMWAASKGNEAICKLLSKAEGDLVTLAGKSSIDFAIENGHSNLVKVINPKEAARLEKKAKGTGK
ncbi:Ankyrin repeat protein [Giardia duodenalis]|uniref:Ankyrin repeat protein n=1 Tax=Giardia intestinalis TaxID=5741 RepID=V6TUB2_GIAIN|nr:Ankyrin repeat protein [Giardia intestinalis]